MVHKRIKGTRQIGNFLAGHVPRVIQKIKKCSNFFSNTLIPFIYEWLSTKKNSAYSEHPKGSFKLKLAKNIYFCDNFLIVAKIYSPFSHHFCYSSIFNFHYIIQLFRVFLLKSGNIFLFLSTACRIHCLISSLWVRISA